MTSIFHGCKGLVAMRLLAKEAMLCLFFDRPMCRIDRQRKKELYKVYLISFDANRQHRLLSRHRNMLKAFQAFEQCLTRVSGTFTLVYDGLTIADSRRYDDDVTLYRESPEGYIVYKQ